MQKTRLVASPSYRYLDGQCVSPEAEEPEFGERVYYITLHYYQIKQDKSVKQYITGLKEQMALNSL